MQKPSVLFITTSSNWPLTDGKRQRTWFLIEGLAKKYIVDILFIGFEGEKDKINPGTSVNEVFFVDLKECSDIRLESIALTRNSKQKAFLKKTQEYIKSLYTAKNYSFVFSRYIDPLQFFPLQTDIKIICDIDDVYQEKATTRIQNEKGILRKMKLRGLHYFGAKKASKIYSRINTPIVVKESDKKVKGLHNSVCLPNLPFGYFLKSDTNQPEISDFEKTQNHFGFIGKLSYQPNYEGLLFFINSVWKILIQKGFKGKFMIAGSGKIPAVLEQAFTETENIELLGFVESSEVFWNKINVLIVPVFQGGGSNIKVAEALINGKTVVAHPFSARGYESFTETTGLFLPKTEQQWQELLQNITIDEHRINAVKAEAQKAFDLEKWNSKLLEIC